MSYKMIRSDGQSETVIKKSRFICHLKRVRTEEEARAFIQQIKKTHHKARHNCSAFILGKDASIKRSSDDGEPSGTAGIPILGALENLELTDVAAVVTRYFGGIKLGAGGLIRAYAGSVSQAVQELGRVEVRELQGLRIRLSYAQYQEFSNFLKAHNLTEGQTDFAADVCTEIFVDQEETQALIAELTDYYQGKAGIELSGIQETEVPIA